MKIVNNVELTNNNEYTGLTFAFFKFVTSDTVNLIHNDTTCTDYLTDKLMYPNKAIPLFETDSPDFKDNLQIACCLNTDKQVENFMEYGLPVLHKIEKLNGMKRTKVIRGDNRQLFFIGSKQWFRSTYHLSFYLKFIRSYKFLTKTPKTVKDLILKEGFDMTDLNDVRTLKIVWTGNLRNVNKYCRYKHGYKGATDGTHNNNGISNTLIYSELKGTPRPNWAIYTWEMAQKFSRADNVKRILAEHKDTDILAKEI